MRIGIDCRMIGWTGVGRYTKNLLTNLFTIDFQNEYFLFFLKNDFEKFVVPNNRIKKILVSGKAYSYGEQTSFLWALKKINPDLVHFTHFSRPIFFGGRSVVTIHDLTHLFFPGEKMKSFFKKWAYGLVLSHSCRTAEKIIAVSENTKKDLRKFLGIAPHKIEVIYEGVEANYREVGPEEIERVRKKYHLTKPYILYIGVWRVHKNLVGLIKAFGYLKNKYNPNIDLVVGGKHDSGTSVFETIKKFNLKDNVLLPGFVAEEDLPALYSGAELFVFPSFYEGFGLPILEAMSCGVPVVCSNTSSLPEVAGEAAQYFDPYNPEEMAEAIREVLINKGLAETLRQKGFERVGNFSWHRMAKETLSVYEQVGKKVRG